MGRNMKFRKTVITALAFLVFVSSLSAWVYLPGLPADAPKVLVSVDRTWWNRLGLNRLTHVRALRKAGLQPVIVDYAASRDADLMPEDLLNEFDGLIVAGGGDVDPTRYGSDEISGEGVNAQRDTFELALLETAELAGMPILGICRGAQLINVYRGGTLGDFRDESQRYARHHRIFSGHAVRLERDSRLASIFGTAELAEVVTYHGQHVDRPGSGVQIVGYALDGTPEAIEVKTRSAFGMLGVQWHAEAGLWDAHQAELYAAFANAARAFRDNN